MLTGENGTSSSKPNTQMIPKRHPTAIIIPSPQVISSSVSNSASFHPYLPYLSPLLPKPKSEILTPNCSSSSTLLTQQMNNAAHSSSQAKVSKLSSTKFFERPRTERVDAATSTRIRPSSLKKMRARAKQLRLLSGRALATECGAGTTCGASSQPDLIQNHFLIARMLRFLRHSRQKVPYLNILRQKVTYFNVF